MPLGTITTNQPGGGATITYEGTDFIVPAGGLPAGPDFVVGKKVGFTSHPSPVPGRFFANDIHKPTFAELANASKNFAVPAPVKPQVAPPVVVHMPLPSRAGWSRTLDDDYDAIKRELAKWNTGGFWYRNQATGNTVWIDTAIRSADADALRDYLYAELHDSAIPKPPGEKQLYYYVTALNPPMKKGFRITGHGYKSTEANRLGSDPTYGVLHIDSQN